MLTGLLIAGMLGSATLGGVYFAFSNFVMKALARLPAGAGAEAMQQINVVVLNIGFLAIFFGTAVASSGAVIASLVAESGDVVLITAGAALYCGGSLGVTIARNVPLNDLLARTPTTSAGLGPVWDRYLARWTFWNHVRTAASLLAALAFALAMFNRA